MRRWGKWNEMSMREKYKKNGTVINQSKHIMDWLERETDELGIERKRDKERFREFIHQTLSFNKTNARTT